MYNLINLKQIYKLGKNTNIENLHFGVRDQNIKLLLYPLLEKFLNFFKFIISRLQNIRNKSVKTKLDLLQAKEIQEKVKKIKFIVFIM